MKLNIDKDQLVRNKFWILLALAAPLILAAQYFVLGPVSEDIDVLKKKALNQLNAARNIKPPFYNNSNIDSKKDLTKKLKDQENLYWSKLYARQAPDMFWPAEFEKLFPMNDGKFLRELKYLDGGPPPVPDDAHHFTGRLVNVENTYLTVVGKDGKKERFYRVGGGKEEMKLDKDYSFHKLPLDKDVQVTFQTGRYFNDKFNEAEQATYVRSYGSQIRPILDIVEPVNEEGDGVVILKDWLVPKKTSELPPATVRFLRFVPPPWKAAGDISEEAWLAQEDLWIQKEFYRRIRQANDYVGKMEGMGGKAVVGFNKPATYKNTYFELALKLLSKDKLEATIKNLQDHRQKLEVKFKIRFSENPAEVETVLIEGEPLDPKPKGTDDGKGKPKDQLTKIVELKEGKERTGIYHVEQALTWETAAVRRIDLISIGSTAPDEGSLSHRTYPDGVKSLLPEPKKDFKPGEVADGPAGAPPPRFGGTFPVGGPGLPSAFVTVNGLNKNRYSEEPTEQTRRLPVALSLIVNQDHIDRVLTSLGNSDFRFVLNQMLVNRYPLSVRPTIVAAETQPTFGGLFPKGFPGIPSRPTTGLPSGAAPPTGDEENEASVELVLYGTVTVYQRYPPRKLPKAAEAPAAP